MESVSLKSQNPLFLACQLLGVLPCDRNLNTSRFGIFYSLAVNFSIFGWVCYIKMWQGIWDSKRASRNFIVELMIAIRELSDFLIVGAHACSLLLKSNTLEKVMTGIKFLELPIVSDKTNRKIYFVIFIICYWIVMSVASKLCPPLYFHSQMNKIEMELPYIISFFAAASFSALINFLRNQLNYMTETLLPNEKRLSLQLDLALFILDLSRSLNTFFAMQIFLLCFRVLINLILSGYFIVDSFRPNSLFTPPDVVWINFFVWIVLFTGLAGDLSVLIRICSSCTSFQNAVESFNDKLFYLMRENNHLCNSDKLYLYVTIKQRVQFTACGFYSLGYPLVTSIIATATTHLVILVQFTSSD